MSPTSLLLSTLAISGLAFLDDEPLPDDLVAARWAQSVDEAWRPLDDPEAEGLPEGLRVLPGTREAVFESPTAPRFLLVRRFAEAGALVDAFMADEEGLRRHGELVPLDDRPLTLSGREAISFDCEWNDDTLAARVSAFYFQEKDGTTRGLWLVTTDDLDFGRMRDELQSATKRFLKSDELEAQDAYSAILLGHDLSFSLKYSAKDSNAPKDSIRLRPAATPAADLAFLNDIDEANPQFRISHLRHWAHEERGVSLSYQIFAHDMNLGPKTPFVHWLAGVFQELRRIDKEKGDFPLELVHLPAVTTNVPGDEEVAQHFRNNERAPEDGVILKVYLPKSPFPHVCQIRWNEPEKPAEEGTETTEEGALPTKEHGWARFVELREYRRGRSELITRVYVVFLLARADDPADLELLESKLDLAIRPLEGAARFPVPR
jgi:hypothetical protein